MSAKRFLGSAAGVVALVGTAGAVAGCEEESTCAASYADVGDGSAAAVCQPATQAGTGGICVTPAQICPDLSPVRFCRATPGEPQQINILLLNRGEDPLTIDELVVRGDERCAFKNVQIDPPLGHSVKGGDAAILNFTYDPPDEGEDHAVIELTSDAENAPTLLIWSCGLGVAAGGTAPGECVTCQDKTQAAPATCGGA